MQKVLTEPDSQAARDFASLIKKNFISQSQRYFSFSSHIISALQSFREYADPMTGSKRNVILQALPHIHDLLMAQRINPSIATVREALRCGFIPGLIYDQRPQGRWEAQAIQDKAIKKNNTLSENDPVPAFKKLLEVFFTGEKDHVPEPLLSLL
jgi:hypothetical protein